jgi:hypothetical protein
MGTLMRVPYLGQYKRNFQNVIFTQPRNISGVYSPPRDYTVQSTQNFCPVV